jgi:tetratricopeptide (TPR) repeat protein
MSFVLAFLLAAAPPPLLTEPDLPPCAQEMAAKPTACDTAIAGEKDSKLKARLLLRRAYQHNEKHDYDAALGDLSAAIEADPALAMAWHERSYTYSELREFARAAADSDHDVTLRPEALDAYRERAFARHGLGDLKGAWEDRSKIVALEPSSAGARIARGKAALWLGRFDEARADTQAALALAEKGGGAEAAAEARAQLAIIALWTTRSPAASPEAACRAAEKRQLLGTKEAIGDCTAAFLAARTPHAKAEMLTLRSLAFLVAVQDQGPRWPTKRWRWPSTQATASGTPISAAPTSW